MIHEPRVLQTSAVLPRTALVSHCVLGGSPLCRDDHSGGAGPEFAALTCTDGGFDGLRSVAITPSLLHC